MNEFIIVHENVLDGSSSSTGISIRKNLALNTRSMFLIFLGSLFGAIVVSIFDQWAEVHPEKPSKPSSISKSDGKIKIQNHEPSVLHSVKVAWLMSFPNSVSTAKAKTNTTKTTNTQKCLPCLLRFSTHNTPLLYSEHRVLRSP
mmetsp:Transcript_4848/g.7068  ORF Transcript_4848/g.7068 Transcript_4848/m.7068 type:complete len:144 (-) Transcript_4848:88-519(-)